jgi:cytochrome c556
MTKSIIAVGLATLLSSSLSAYDLKSNMLLLNAELSEVQRAFIASDQSGVEQSVKRFAQHAQDLLGNKEKFSAMLPEKKKNKANEAVMSAQIISHNVQIILDAIENKYNQSGQVRREEAQRAYTYIEHACFRCHNIVRDEY